MTELFAIKHWFGCKN